MRRMPNMTMNEIMLKETRHFNITIKLAEAWKGRNLNE